MQKRNPGADGRGAEERAAARKLGHGPVLGPDSAGPPKPTIVLGNHLQSRIAELETALRELLKGGEHPGPCDSEDDDVYLEGGPGTCGGPCTLHLAAAGQREAHARAVLQKAGPVSGESKRYTKTTNFDEKKFNWKLALEDAERELRRAEAHVSDLKNAIPILRQRVEERGQ